MKFIFRRDRRRDWQEREVRDRANQYFKEYVRRSQ